MSQKRHVIWKPDVKCYSSGPFIMHVPQYYNNAYIHQKPIPIVKATIVLVREGCGACRKTPSEHEEVARNQADTGRQRPAPNLCHYMPVLWCPGCSEIFHANNCSSPEARSMSRPYAINPLSAVSRVGNWWGHNKTYGAGLDAWILGYMTLNPKPMILQWGEP